MKKISIQGLNLLLHVKLMIIAINLQILDYKIRNIVFSDRIQMTSMLRRQANDGDRISALPDTILCHILSFLETMHAVRTIVLSTRWNNIWTSVPNLDFNDGHKSFSFESEDPFEGCPG